jgi:hypothetical protein
MDSALSRSSAEILLRMPPTGDGGGAGVGFAAGDGAEVGAGAGAGVGALVVAGAGAEVVAGAASAFAGGGGGTAGAPCANASGAAKRSAVREVRAQRSVVATFMASLRVKGTPGGRSGHL